MLVAMLAFFLCADPIAEIARDAGHVGAAAAVLEGKTILQFHAGEAFPMQSVYKLPIGMAVLASIDGGKLRLDQKIHVLPKNYLPAGWVSPLRDAHPGGAEVTLAELLRLAVSESDGSASDVLLRVIGGPPAVMQFLEHIGVRGIHVQTSEAEMGPDWSVQYRNSATPDGAVALLRALEDSRGISHASRDLLLDFMTQSKTFPTRIKGQLPKGTVVAHKTGSSGVRNGIAAATNDIGIVRLPDGRHLAIAVFVSDSPLAADERDRVIARITAQAWREANP